MNIADLTANLPPVWAHDLLPQIHQQLADSGKTLVVLDDDPTGTQTVFDVPVLTQFDQASIAAALEEAPPVLYILTNSRALTVSQTTVLHQELGATLKEFKDEIMVISRSDSTLRGHFPLEINILRETLNLPKAPTLFIPYFEAGGRITVEDTHYIVKGDDATPAHLTPFAKDHAFPFSHSYLPDYFAEKSGSPVDVQSISLQQLRSGDVSEELANLPDGCTCIINATERRDLEVLATALHASDRDFLFRTAASFVQTFAGIPVRPPLEPWQLQDLEPNPNGGLIVIGSHVPKTSRQLAHLIKSDPNLVPIELNVPEALEQPASLIPKLADEVTAYLAFGKNVVLYTSREVVVADGMKKNLQLSQVISDTIVSLIKNITLRPRFLLSKGGITSSTIATDALGITKALVIGQILPGIPVWTLGAETRFPGLAYVIFPGNVGSDESLTEAYTKLTTV
ncbi:MAG: four-carbon acid sugar kinase family protein [Roseibacillus sp.]